MSFPSSIPASLPSFNEEFSPREIRFSLTREKRSDTRVRFHFDPATQQLAAFITKGEMLRKIPREAIHGIPEALSASQICQFVQSAILLCSEENDQLTLQDPKRFFIEELTAQKKRELEVFSSSLDEIVQAQNGPQFIYEFIQNAHDASDPGRELDVAFILFENALVISHSGKHFDESDIRTICSTQNKESRKRKEAQSIGYKGVGFKSIFNHTNTVTIVSEHSFRFDKLADEWKDQPDFPWELCPLYTPSEPLIEQYGLDVSRVNYVIQLNRSENRIALHLEEFFNHNAPEVFFFLPRLAKLRFENVQASRAKCVLQKRRLLMQKGPDDPPSEEEDRAETEVETFGLTKNEVQIGSWLRYIKNISLPSEIKAKLETEPRIPERYKEMVETPVSFILPLHEEKKKRASLYCYLPTTVSLGLSIPINAHFFLDISRQALQKDHFFNEFLFNCIGLNLFHFYAYIALHHPEKFFPVLEIPANLTFDTNPQTYRSSFQQGADHAMLTLSFLPSQEGTLIKPQEAVIDEWGFASKFESTSLKKRLLYKSASKHNQMLEQMGVARYGWEKIVARLKLKKFTEWVAANPQLGLSLLRYFKTLFEANRQKEEIKQLPFLLSHYPPESSEPLFPPPTIYFPHHLPIKGLEFVKVPLLHPHIRESLTEEETKWLTESVFVSTASLTTYVEEINKAKSESLVGQVLPVLYGMFRSEAPLPKEFQNLKLPVQLKQNKREFLRPNQCYLPDVLQPRHSLQRDIAPQYESFLSEAIYYSIPVEERAVFRDFLLTLGVSDRITEENIDGIVKKLTTDAQRVSFIQLIYHSLYLLPEEESVFNACAAKLREKSLLITIRGLIKRPVDCFLPSDYQPQMDLFAASPLVREHLPFVSADYIHASEAAKSWKKFFLKLCVRERLEIQTHDSMNAATFHEKLKKEMEQIGWTHSSSSDPQVNYIEFLWKKADYPTSNACVRGMHAVPFTGLGCAPTNNWRSQHTISPVLWIEYAFLIKGTQLFWQMIRTHWEDFKRYLQETISYRTYCSSREQGIPSMLDFYTQNAVATDSGEYLSPHDIYSPTLRWLVHPVLPVPKEDFPLTDEQLTYFKFKTQLSLPHCLQLLRALQEHPEDSLIEKKLNIIYTHLVKSIREPYEFPPDLRLMAEDGSLKEPSQLFGNCVEGLSFKSSASYLLKRPPDLNLEQYAFICQLFGIQTLVPEILLVEFAEEHIQAEFKQKVIRRLPFVFGAIQTEARFQELERCARKVESLQFVTAPEITLSFQAESTVFKELVFAWLHNQIVYGRESFDHSRTLSQTARFLCFSLDLPCRTEELVHLLSASDSQISEDYSYRGETELYKKAQELAKLIEEKVKIPMVVTIEEKNEDAMDLDAPPKPITPPVSPIKRENPYTLKRKASSSFSGSNPSFKKFAASSLDSAKPYPVLRFNYPRRAEEAVLSYFIKRYQTQEQHGVVVKTNPDPSSPWDRKIVRWINYYSEAYGNHDFKIDYMKGDTLIKTKYLEVKSKDPTSQHIGSISLSDEENALMDQAGSNYSIWIVKFKAEGEPTLHKVPKVYQNLQGGMVQRQPYTRTYYSVTIPEENLLQK